MRSVLFVFLVGCGGGTKAAPPPVSNQPPATEEASKPMIAETTRPTCTEVSAKCAVATMEYFSNEVCACKDKACVMQVNEDMTKWGTEMAKKATAIRDDKPDPALAQKSADIMTRYTECMTKILMDGTTPPPDPCAGGADPCGG